jgi:hypothetical protein
MYGLRGLGADYSTGVNVDISAAPMNCPGDPRCPGYVSPDANQQAAIQAALAAAASGACTCQGGPPGGAGTCAENGNSCTMPGGSGPIVPTAVSQTFGQWLSLNGLYVGLGVAGFFMLMAVSKR